VTLDIFPVIIASVDFVAGISLALIAVGMRHYLTSPRPKIQR
jgi:hypothetical protein